MTIAIEWTKPSAALFEAHGFEACNLSNGEKVGAIAQQPNGKWTVVQGYGSRDTREEAVRDLTEKAQGRIEFLERITC